MLFRAIPVLFILVSPALAGPFGDAVAMVQRAEQYDAANQPNQPDDADGLDIALRESIENQFPGALRGGGAEIPEADSAEAQPTPWPAVFDAVTLLELTNEDVLADYGCGGDARVLTHAWHRSGCKCIGIEIDETRATTASHRIRMQLLHPWVKIIHGDAVTTEVKANKAFAYLFPETLRRLKPQIEKIDRFVSFGWQVPGLDMKHIRKDSGDFYLWEKPEPVETVQRSFRTYDRLPSGSYCQQCGGYCRNPMSHWYTKNHEVKVKPDPFPAAPAQAANRTIAAPVRFTPNYTSRQANAGRCANGRCSRRGGFFRRMFQ